MFDPRCRKAEEMNGGDDGEWEILDCDGKRKGVKNCYGRGWARCSGDGEVLVEDNERNGTSSLL
jgi:hypothetical protein